MKNSALVLILCFVIVLGAWLTDGCRRANTSDVTTLSTSATEMEVVTIPVEGMVCGSCVARTKGALKSVAGVHEVEVSLEKRVARIRYDSSKTSPDRLAAIINELGYKAGTPTENKK